MLGSDLMEGTEQMTRTKKICPGLYERTDGVRCVEITYYENMKGWIAAAGWDQHLYTDPIDTKRDAILNADEMLKDRAMGVSM